MKVNQIFLHIIIASFVLLSIDATLQAQSRKAVRSVTKKECDACEYFPLCKYDGSVTYGGKKYIDVTDDNERRTFYYRCDSGVVTRIWETSYTPTDVAIEYDPFTNTETTIYTTGTAKHTVHGEVFLVTNGPVGTKWGKRNYSFTIQEKGISVTVDGTRYDDVLVVNEDNFRYFYYAKGVGFINEVPRSDYMPSAASVDSTLIGAWELEGYKTSQFQRYWIFNEDGTGACGWSGVKLEGEKDFHFKWGIEPDHKLLVVFKVDGNQARYELIKTGESLLLTSQYDNKYVLHRLPKQ